MQIIDFMKLTENQKANINNIDSELALDILHECAERLGIVSVSQYCEIMGCKKRTVYIQIEQNKIKSIDFCGNKLIVINN